MISILDKKKCCGCAACAQACPKKCIEMIEDEEGFLYPSVDSSQCVDCGLCEKKCPILHVKQEKNISSKPDAFIAYQKEIASRLKSSSGGLFSVFASKVLSENGVVYGAAFDDYFQVHHIAAENVEQLKLLRGSKYVQSRTGETFIKVRDLLQSGRKVLFTGTACQIAGLKNFLGADDDNLYTIDVLCHGVPSPKLWKHYLHQQEIEHGSSVNYVFFRDKKQGWKKFNISLAFSNGKVYEKLHSEDSFMQLFLGNICIRPSCHDCRFKDVNRPSDITIGDCWGVERYMPEMDDDKGISIMLVHSEKGHRLLKSIESQLCIVNAELDKALPPNADSRKSVLAHPKRKQFFEMLDKGASLKQLTYFLKQPLHVRAWRKCKSVLRMIKVH